MSSDTRIEDVRRACAGDEDALQRLLVHYHAALRHAVHAATTPELRVRIDSDDVLQQAYISAFEALPRARFDGPAAFYAWLETIALSRLKDQQRALRRQKRNIKREVSNDAQPDTSYPGLVSRLADSIGTPSQFVARDEAIAAVMSCLARLGADQREVVRLRFLEGQPVAEVARRLGKTEAAVHMLCHRGLKALRERMVSISSFLTRH